MSIKTFLPGILLLAGGSVFGQQTLTCSSDDMHRHYCGADTRSGVQLVQQRSGSVCRQGYSWGYDRSGVWVDHGCRADFVIGNRRAYGYGNNGYGNNGYGYGNNNGYGYPDNSGYGNNGYGYGRERREREREREREYRDRNYGYRDNSQYGYGNNGYGYGNNGYGNYASTMSCSSDDMRRHYCGANIASGVQLLRQRSDAACRQGYSWGYDRRGVWVDHGCRADFAVR